MEQNQQNENNYPINIDKNEIYEGYTRAPCAQQSQPQNFLPPYGYNVPQQLMYNQNQPMYNIMYGSQPLYRNQSTLNSFSQPMESWVPEPYSEPPKEKYTQTIKENNCCGTDMTCVYKSVNKSFYYNKNGIMDSWFYNNYDNQKYNELPSCSRVSENNLDQCCDLGEKKSVKYCSIQKCSEDVYSSCSQLNISQSCNLYSSQNPSLENYFPSNNLHFDVPKIDEKATEESNAGESDIVVEDSEEETEESEIEKEDRQCYVCHVSIVNGYDLNSNTPLLLYSQTPVCQFLNNILEINENINSSLCNNCINLINAIDNFQIQLNNVRQELISKYKMSLTNFKTVLNTSNQSPIKKLRKKRKFKRDICGVHRFKCTVCEKIFSLKNFYVFHMAKHKTKSKYLCEYCGCNFIKQSSLSVHLKKHSKLMKKFICYVCGKIFKTKSNLTEHENSCSGKKPFGCNFCARKFASSTKLKQHIQLLHEKSFSVTCQKCDKGFIKKSDLKAHLITHSTTKKYQCIKCNKSYKTLSNLNQHLKIHEKNLPFSCTICSKGFLRKENLETHLNLHNGIKPFECRICNKKFASQKFLNAHLKIHNGTAKVKPCPICGKEIRHGLEDHMRTHNNKKEINCDICDTKFLTKSAMSKHKKRKHENDVDVL